MPEQLQPAIRPYAFGDKPERDDGTGGKSRNETRTQKTPFDRMDKIDTQKGKITMNSLLFLIGALILVGLVLAVMKKNKKGDLSYRAKNVMTEAERKLYYTLKAAVEDAATVLAQVNMSSFLNAKGQGYTAFNKISKKSVDFLVCDKNGLPILAIELQDRSHEKEDRKKNDEEKAYALKIAKIPLVEFEARKLPDVATAKEAIRPFMENTR